MPIKYKNSLFKVSCTVLVLLALFSTSVISDDNKYRDHNDEHEVHEYFNDYDDNHAIYTTNDGEISYSINMFEPISITSIWPGAGTVTGGDLVLIQGENFRLNTYVAIGGIACNDVNVISSNSLTCTTGNLSPYGGLKDVVVEASGVEAILQNGFEYTCPWYFDGVANCGAVPPILAPEQSNAFVISNFQAGHGFYANSSGGGTQNYADTTDYVIGSQSAYITSNASGIAPKTLKKLGAGLFDFSNSMPRLTIKLDNVVNLSRAHLYLGSNNLSDMFKFSFKSSQGQKWTTDGDWVSFSIPWNGPHVSISGSPDRTNITDVQLRIVDDGVQAVTLHVNEISAATEQRTFPNGVLSINFDDAFESQYTVAKPLLDNKGYAATAYVIAEKIGNTIGYMSMPQLHDLHDAGWEIAAHSHTNDAHAAAYTNLTAEALEQDIVSNREWIITNGFRGYDHCAYPKGYFKTSTDSTTLDMVRKYFTSCRTINELHTETFPPSDPHKLRVYYITNSEQLEKAKAAIDNAVANKAWIIMVFHKLVDTPTKSTEWGIADFSALMDHVEASGIAVKTVGEVMSSPVN